MPCFNSIEGLSALFTTPALLFLSRAWTSPDRVNLFIICPTGRWEAHCMLYLSCSPVYPVPT